ncbi:SDR family oxidoreductase [Shinella curvata]|uniref:SDR family oxidoreductase n=1 Tax=Shinella curvata TaxID=1817964 RepID=A0ABT8XB42_9HYPH|nr:SDR family NAD(P)-dependent oxidoreductase [Shinella curvata]MCJ8054666.1 SDR family oxidoreductase [Shinella curvata]MDO6120939.1 SDR family oxidoreductase [Shinella curvata]
MNLNLNGQVALVTGSTKGIGFAVAAGLASMGAEVVVQGRSQRSVDAAVEALRVDQDVHVRGIAADLTIASDISRLCEELPRIDVLVNNAGFYNQKDFFQITDDEWDEMFRLNLMSGVCLTRHYLQGMLDKGWGRIVNVSSESGVFIPKEMIHYGVSKAAQLAFSRGVAELTAGTNVTVNSVLPGPTWVETTSDQIKQRALEQNVSERELMARTFSTRRPTSLIQRYTTPEEVANVICFLCSPAAAATNGAPIRADGGIVRTFA